MLPNAGSIPATSTKFFRNKIDPLLVVSWLNRTRRELFYLAHEATCYSENPRLGTLQTYLTVIIEGMFRRMFGRGDNH